MKYIDLHSHTEHSDGTSTVTNSLQCAQSLSLSLFSVSDHNTVSAYREIADKRALFSGKILPAVELSTVFEKENIEVLGYGIDVGRMAELIKDNYCDLDTLWYEELKIYIWVLLENGAILGRDYLQRVNKKDPTLRDSFGGARSVLLDELKRYPENALLFGGQEQFEKTDRHIFARQWLSNPDSPLYCDRSAFVPDFDKAVAMIKESGGLAFLAHPYVYSPRIVQSLPLLSEKLDGMECHYGTFNKEQKAYLSDFCDQNGLYKSGGSDFHGLDMRPKNIMGLSGGEKIELSLIEPWFDKIKDSLI